MYILGFGFTHPPSENLIKTKITAAHILRGAESGEDDGVGIATHRLQSIRKMTTENINLAATFECGGHKDVSDKAMALAVAAAVAAAAAAAALTRRREKYIPSNDKFNFALK